MQTGKKKVALDLKGELLWRLYTLRCTHTVHKHLSTNTSTPQIPRQARLFRIIPSDKINAPVYEVIALMAHTLLRWHSVLHTLNMTPIAYCASSQVSLPFFSLYLSTRACLSRGHGVVQWNWQVGGSQGDFVVELTLSWEARYKRGNKGKHSQEGQNIWMPCFCYCLVHLISVYVNVLMYTYSAPIMFVFHMNTVEFPLLSLL